MFWNGDFTFHSGLWGANAGKGHVWERGRRFKYVNLTTEKQSLTSRVEGWPVHEQTGTFGLLLGEWCGHTLRFLKI